MLLSLGSDISSALNFLGFHYFPKLCDFPNSMNLPRLYDFHGIGFAPALTFSSFQDFFPISSYFDISWAFSFGPCLLSFPNFDFS